MMVDKSSKTNIPSHFLGKCVVNPIIVFTIIYVNQYCLKMIRCPLIFNLYMYKLIMKIL